MQSYLLCGSCRPFPRLEPGILAPVAEAIVFVRVGRPYASDAGSHLAYKLFVHTLHVYLVVALHRKGDCDNSAGKSSGAGR